MQVNKTGSHRSCLPSGKWLTNIQMYPFTLLLDYVHVCLCYLFCLAMKTSSFIFSLVTVVNNDQEMCIFQLEKMSRKFIA